MFVNNLLLQDLEKHPGNTLIKKERVSKRKRKEREELTMICKAGNNCKTLRCIECGCLELRHSGASPGAREAPGEPVLCRQ